MRVSCVKRVWWRIAIAFRRLILTLLLERLVGLYSNIYQGREMAFPYKMLMRNFAVELTRSYVVVNFAPE